jgi:hypothetical protein
LATRVRTTQKLFCDGRFAASAKQVRRRVDKQKPS